MHLWNFFVGGVLTILYNRINHLPLMTNTCLDGSFWSCINKILGITLSGPVYNGPLWYVRNLLILFVFAPLFILLRKFYHGLPLYLVIFSCICLIAFNYNPIPCFNVKMSSMMFFLIGMAVAGTPLPVKSIQSFYSVGIGLVWALCAVLRTLPVIGFHSEALSSIFLYHFLSVIGGLFI